MRLRTAECAEMGRATAAGEEALARIERERVKYDRHKNN
jgi:hypothetical protein